MRWGLDTQYFLRGIYAVTSSHYNIAIVISSEYHDFKKMKIQIGTAKHLSLISSEYRSSHVFNPWITIHIVVFFYFYVMYRHFYNSDRRNKIYNYTGISLFTVFFVQLNLKLKLIDHLFG